MSGAPDTVVSDAARESFEAMIQGGADICFLAIEPAWAAEVAFTAPYVIHPRRAATLGPGQRPRGHS